MHSRTRRPDAAAQATAVTGQERARTRRAPTVLRARRRRRRRRRRRASSW
jgi:hypothetical protein